MSKKRSLPKISFKPLFFGNIYVCFTKADFDEWDGFKFGSQAPFVQSGNAGQCTHWPDKDILISIDPTKHDTFETLTDTMAHESLHAAKWLFNDIGDKETSEEVMCRLTGQITAFVMSEYLKKRKKIRK